jgi:uncharacterized protein YecE (DUF72 family)
VLVLWPPRLGFAAGGGGRFWARRRRPRATRVACEPRHASWFAPAADVVFARHAIARAAADPARLPEAAHPGGAGAAARWNYWRWHGSPRIYYSRYDDDALEALARALVREGSTRAPAWCVLDNTAHGHAIGDAARLQALVAGGLR